METFLADDDYRARVARIEETRAIGDQITELSGHINATTYRLLTLIAEFGSFHSPHCGPQSSLLGPQESATKG